VGTVTGMPDGLTTHITAPMAPVSIVGRTETRGRPRIRQDAEILDAALKAFAAQGYDAMSLRALNAELGLSHGTISQRFGSKERLYFAAVDLGFATFVADIDQRRRHLLADQQGADHHAGDAPNDAPSDAPSGHTGEDTGNHGDDLGELRATIRAFLGAALLRPELGRLMNQEGLQSTRRLDHIVGSVILPMLETVGILLDRLHANGRIRPITARALFFLVTHGAEAPYTLAALSAAFDPVDGPLDPERHGNDMTDLIMRGITVA